jgi:diadenosine tetraphosphate (Ap4A) HIT family hydrolase
MAPWFNIQFNGNWGLLPGNTPFFHLHVYGRNKTANWAKPVVLPEAPKTYQNAPMPEADQSKLIEAFRAELG